MVPVIQKILFTTDLSENSRHAFSYAASEATRHGASIVLIHVIEEGTTSVDDQLAGVFGKEKWSQMKADRERTARDTLIGKKSDYDIIRSALADLCAETNSGDSQISFETHEILVTQGNVSQEILKAATEKGCDMIVIGTHRGLMGKTAVAGVAKAILQGSSVPVLFVPAPKAA